MTLAAGGALSVTAWTSATARTPATARTSAATAETPSAEEMIAIAVMGGQKQQARYIVFFKIILYEAIIYGQVRILCYKTHQPFKLSDKRWSFLRVVANFFL
jgi:hypothetical protein